MDFNLYDEVHREAVHDWLNERDQYRDEPDVDEEFIHRFDEYDEDEEGDD